MIDPMTTGEDRTFKARGAPRTRTALAAALLVLGAGGGADPGRAAVTIARDSRVVLRAADRCGASLAANERRAVEEALLARAWEAGVVVCHDGLASPGPAAFAVICAGPSPDVSPFWWDLRLETPRSERAQVASATLRLALSDGPPREAPELFLLGPFVLSSGGTVAGAQAEALRAVTDSLRSSPALLGWLRGLAARPELLHARPIPAGSSSEDAMPAPDSGGDEVSAWKAEILRITDLLIDGNDWQLREAVDKADRLLREDRLPPDLAARARELKEKAVAKLASAEDPSLPMAPNSPEPARPPAPPNLPATPSAAAPRGEAVVAEHSDVTFAVRLAVVGKGFGIDSEGQLRLARAGIAFHRKGQAAADWSVSWADLASASHDNGLWESPFTILLVERAGRKRYLSLIDGHGHYVTGEPLLNAITAGRKAFRRPPGKVAGESLKQGETP